MPVIMGTAGHIDHGKTTLVKALTGIDCDRLAEEKKRGITIELGFAFMDLPGAQRLGVVDVPGHERFVKNMVAGAAGIDFVMLVIAADEGVMPQTREHLEICTLLGVSTGLVALTKTDMVEPDWLEMVSEDVKSYLAPTFLGNAPLIPVSAHTGQGLEQLKSELSRLTAEFKPKRRSDLVRLPIDRVFSMKGYGTVVTGTLISGKIKTADDLLVYPKNLASKARNIQSHGQSSDEALAGLRTAVNLQGLEVDDIDRGYVLGSPGALFPSLTWDLELTCLASSPRPLKHRGEVHFHHGTRELMARIYFLDRDKLEPGETAICQARFEEPLTGVYADRCVLRSFSPLRTVAGAKLVNPLGRKVKRFSPDVERLASLSSAQPEELLLSQLDLAGPEGLSFAKLMVLTNLESRELERLLQLLGGQSKLALFDRDQKIYVSGSLARSLLDSALEHFREFHKREPMKLGLPRGELASTWGRDLAPKLFHYLVERLLKNKDITAEQELLKLPAHKVSLASDESKLRQALVTAYAAGGVTPPNLKDVLEPLGLTFKEAAPVFKLLQDQGELVKIKEDMYFHGPSLAALTAKVVDYLKAHGEIGPNEFRELTGLSRKFTIPLLEYLDKEKITVRIGDKRQLRVK